MTIEAIREKILTDDAFVLDETIKLQYLYGLKYEIRYALERHEDISSESVAEHIYGMHILATYFLPLEDVNRSLNWQKVYEMITYHDVDEVETGDMIGYLKTEEIRAAEKTAALRVIQKAPAVVQGHIEKILSEYEELQSEEARFVKAIDRIEPTFHLYNEDGRRIFARNHTTREQTDGLKRPYVKDFPCLKRFFEVISDDMAKQGYYAT